MTALSTYYRGKQDLGQQSLNRWQKIDWMLAGVRLGAVAHKDFVWFDINIEPLIIITQGLPQIRIALFGSIAAVSFSFGQLVDSSVQLRTVTTGVNGSVVSPIPSLTSSMPGFWAWNSRVRRAISGNR